MEHPNAVVPNGHQIPDATTDAIVPTQVVDTPAEPKTNNAWKVIGILCIVLVIVVVGVFGFLKYRKWRANKQDLQEPGSSEGLMTD